MQFTGCTIEREILLNAPVERVWELVSEPGWFVNAGQGTVLHVDARLEALKRAAKVGE